MPKGVYERESFEDRVLAQISKDEITSCWIWTGHLDKDGYGQVSLKSKTVQIHKAYYEFKKGPIPKGYLAGHLCDEKYPKDCKKYRSCCNPDHIKPMTSKENTQRMIILGRYKNTDGCFKPGHGKGEDNVKTILTKEQVLDIRRRKMKGLAYGELKKMVEEFKVKYITLQKIVQGDNWKDPEYFPEGWV